MIIKRYFKEGGLVVFGQLAMVAGSLLIVKALTAFLSPDSYGEFSLGITITNIVGQILLGPLAVGAARYYSPAEEANQLNSYLMAIKKILTSAIGIILAIVSCIALILLIIGMKQWILMTIAAFFLAFISGLNVIFNSIQNAARQRMVVAIHQGIEPWSRIIFVIIFMLFYSTSSSMVMLGFLFGSFFVMLSQSVYIKKFSNKKITIEYSTEWKQKILTFSRPLMLWGGFTAVHLISDKWALQFFSSLDEVAAYAVLYQIGYYPVSLLTAIILQLITPVLYQRAGSGLDGQKNLAVDNLCWRLTFFGLCITILTFFVTLKTHEEIIITFTNKAYSQYSHLLPWVILAGGIFSCGQTLASTLLSQFKTNSLLRLKISSAIIGIILNLLGSYYYGIVGVVFASVLFSLIYFTWMSCIVYFQRAHFRY